MSQPDVPQLFAEITFRQEETMQVICRKTLEVGEQPLVEWS